MGYVAEVVTAFMPLRMQSVIPQQKRGGGSETLRTPLVGECLYGEKKSTKPLLI